MKKSITIIGLVLFTALIIPLTLAPVSGGGGSSSGSATIADHSIEPIKASLNWPRASNYSRIIGSATAGQVPVSTGTNDSHGSPVFVPGASSGGGMSVSNIWVKTTNAIILDFALANTFKLTLSTNVNWIGSNSTLLTSKGYIYYLMDTNAGTGYSVASFANNAGKVDTNTSMQPIGSQSYVEVMPGFFNTNIWCTLRTNFSPTQSPTNSNATGGGGGGGGGAFTYVNSGGQTGTSGDTAVTVDTTGSSMGVVCITYSSGSTPTVSSTLNATGWILATNSGHIAVYSKTTSYVAGNDTLTVATVGGCSVVYLGYSKTTPSFDKFSTEGLIGNWNASLASGATTPTSANDLFVSVGRYDVASGTPTPAAGYNSRFTGFNGTSQNGIMVSDKIKSSDSTSETPTWTPGVNAGASAYHLHVSFQ